MIYFVVSIDVEPDCSPTWHYSNPLTFNGVKIGIKEILHPLFRKYGIVPTYLINNVVLEDEASVDILKNLDGEYELGTHLHPEFIEPQKTIFEYAGSKGEANCCFYDPTIEFEKIKNITLLFEEKLGYKPTSFRAGRFSAGSNTIKSLIELGYKVDTSITPNILWADASRERKVDYRNSSVLPFFTSKHFFPYASSTEDILEVPVSIVEKRHSTLKIAKALFFERKFEISRKIWLRPFLSTFEDFRYILESLENKKKNIVLNMMFHNVEVLPFLSPYTQSLKDCENYIQSLESFFSLLRSKECMFVGITKLYDEYRR